MDVVWMSVRYVREWGMCREGHSVSFLSTLPYFLTGYFNDLEARVSANKLQQCSTSNGLGMQVHAEVYVHLV